MNKKERRERKKGRKENYWLRFFLIHQKCLEIRWSMC
jgi:hypothetical protein